jgi:hypothetical protein
VAPRAAAPRKRGRQPGPEARKKAQKLASRLPFVHFPASTTFTTWSEWVAFKSPAELGRAVPDQDSFEGLRASHVFAYAGPCCFAEPTDLGDAAAYLEPTIDQCLQGETSPFDSGALEGDEARFQDWAGKPESARWKFLRQHTLLLAGWRAELESWLLHCYEDPDRYLDAQEDRYAAGLPDRTRPRMIREHNGTPGRARYGDRCGDRRLWTWEARFAEAVPFSQARVLHIPVDRLQAVEEAKRRGKFGGVASAEVQAVTLPPDVAASPDALYLYSRDAIEVFL